MGRMYAEGLNEAMGEGWASLRQVVSIHLSSNCYPPVPQRMVAPAVAAIEAANEGEWDRLIDLPESVEFRDGRTAVEASTLIDSLRLESFVSYDDDEL